MFIQGWCLTYQLSLFSLSLFLIKWHTCFLICIDLFLLVVCFSLLQYAATTAFVFPCVWTVFCPFTVKFMCLLRWKESLVLEIFQWVEYLPCSHEDLHSDAQNISPAPNTDVHVCSLRLSMLKLKVESSDQVKSLGTLRSASMVYVSWAGDSCLDLCRKGRPLKLSFNFYIYTGVSVHPTLTLGMRVHTHRHHAHKDKDTQKQNILLTNNKERKKSITEIPNYYH